MRKFEAQDDPKAKRPKPSRVSQRCLGRWAATKAVSNTASEAVEVSSEEEGEAPAESGEKTPPVADEEARGNEQREVSPNPTAQEETPSSRTGQEETPAGEEPIQAQVAESTGQGEPSTEAQESPDREEEQYQSERKRKGKAPVQKKQPTKKARTTEQGIIFREQPREELSDGDYSVSEESDSEDESLEDETMNEQQLPGQHWELVHPPVERMEYLPWQVELNDGLMEAMKHFETKKLQDAFDGKDDNSKLIKAGKVLHYPSLDILAAREHFLLYIRALGFDWLLENRDPAIPVRLAKEFFTTFRFRVTTDLDEVSISFRVFGREVSMNLVEWTVRLGMCSLEEAISSEWRARERGIPRRHIEFNPQQAWNELTHPAAGRFESTLSRSNHLNDPILRLVQLYLGYNLLGQSNSAVRTSMTELYFLWSARRGRRIHLGFWTAYQCHLIATHPARNLSLCHILGTFVRNNIAVIESERLSPMYMVDPPGLFDIPFFTRTNNVYNRDGVPRFYAMGEAAAPVARVAAAQEGQAPDQRQVTLERAVADLTEQNRETKEELTRLADLMEALFKKLAARKNEAGTSGQASEQEDTERMAEGPDLASQEDEEEDEHHPMSADDNRNSPEPTPTPTPAPRRSRRNM